jgi:LPS export ABC transporter protein LptC
MRDNYKNIVILLTALCLFGCPGKRGPAEDQEPAARDTMPSQTIAGFRLTETLLGKRVWVMTAEEANSFSQRQEVDLTRLRIDFYREAGDSVNATLTADRGMVNTATRDMEARDHVVIVSRDSLVLTTDSIRWTNSRRLLTTEAKVRLERGTDWLTGEGMEASPDLKEIELKRNVQGQKELLNDLGDLR